MNFLLKRLLFVLAGYIFGLFQTGWLYGKITGVDLTKVGSGNTGATNALRTVGLKGAFIIFFGDTMKGFIPCLLVRLLFQSEGPMVYVLQAYTAFGVILGNDFPFFLHFKGGKGVAATCGWALAVNFPMWCAGMMIFIIVLLLSRIVSLSSIIATIGLTVLAFLFDSRVWSDMWCGDSIEFLGLVILMGLILLLRHHENIERLFSGKEGFITIAKSKEQMEKQEAEQAVKTEEDEKREADLELLRNKVAQNAIRDRAPETAFKKRVFQASGYQEPADGQETK